jgi:hypothetical protein
MMKDVMHDGLRVTNGTTLHRQRSLLVPEDRALLRDRLQERLA